jgi:prophage maintenance system killer protein
MIYPTIDDCRQLLFPYIRSRLVENEPAPSYEIEGSGHRGLEGIFALMQRDEYDGALVKASYLFCSVIGGHHFSNGNKRLGVTLLLYFLLKNGYKVSVTNMSVMRGELVRLFPNLRWEEVQAFHYPHEYFFYHLALIIADRKQKGKMTFAQERSAVAQLLDAIMLRE